MICGMKIGETIEELGAGSKVARAGWNGKGMWLELQVPDANSKMTLPYIFLKYPPGETYPTGARVPWMVSQTDILATDWLVVD